MKSFIYIIASILCLFAFVNAAKVNVDTCTNALLKHYKPKESSNKNTLKKYIKNSCKNSVVVQNLYNKKWSIVNSNAVSLCILFEMNKDLVNKVYFIDKEHKCSKTGNLISWGIDYKSQPVRGPDDLNITENMTQKYCTGKIKYEKISKVFQPKYC